MSERVVPAGHEAASTGPLPGARRRSAPRRRRATWWLIGLVLVVAGAVLAWPRLWLEMRLHASGAPVSVRRVPAAAGDIVAVRYIHSVERVEVIEYFALEASGDLTLIGTRYGSGGAGLPTDPGEGTFRIDGDAFVIEGLRRPIGDLQLRLAPMNDYTVVHRGNSYRWPDAPNGAQLTVRGVRSGWLAAWLVAKREERFQ